MAIHEPRVVWMSGPHSPADYDITIFCGGDAKVAKEEWDQSSLYFQLKDGDLVVGDSGYAGEPGKIVTTKSEHSAQFRGFLARVKNQQETFHGRLKAFDILGGRFRHGRSTSQRKEIHKMAVEAVATIIQYDYENGHPPLDVI